MGYRVGMEGEKRKAIRRGIKWAEWLPRAGYVVRGLLYATVGFLALQVAFGAGGMTTDFQGAIATISARGAGQATLAFILVGLVGYSLWGFVRALLDPLNRGTSPKSLAERAGYFVSGLSYGALVVPTFRYLTGAGHSPEGNEADWTAWLLAQPYGGWLLAGVGAIAIVGSVGQFWQAYTASYCKDFKTEEMSEKERHFALWLGRSGLAARGVVFMLLGWFVVLAALRTNPDEVRGLDGALQALVQHRLGTWALGAVAAGLLAFGVFSAMSARWMKVVKKPGEA